MYLFILLRNNKNAKGDYLKAKAIDLHPLVFEIK